MKIGRRRPAHDGEVGGQRTARGVGDGGFPRVGADVGARVREYRLAVGICHCLAGRAAVGAGGGAEGYGDVLQWLATGIGHRGGQGVGLTPETGAQGGFQKEIASGVGAGRADEPPRERFIAAAV